MVTEIIPNLLLGDAKDAENLGTWVPEDWACISVTEYWNETPNEPKGGYLCPFMAHDIERRPLELDRLASVIHTLLKEGKKVLVHCVHAHERSPLAVAWYLVWSKHSKDLNEAYDFIIAKHPTAVRRLYWLPQSAQPYPQNGEVFKNG